MNNTLRNSIQMLQGHYRFLMLGKYLEFMIQNKDFSKEVLDIAVVTGKRSHFGIKSSLIKTLLKQIYEHPDQKNIFGHMVEIGSFRGIFSIMRELLENDVAFKVFATKKLNDQYFAFEQIIRLLRNILSHSTTTDIYIREEDIEKQKQYLQFKEVSDITFDMKYSSYFSEWTGSSDYHLHIDLPIKKLKPGTSLFDLLSLHQLYLLCELCFNLSEVFRGQKTETKPKSNTSPKKTIGKNKSKS